MAIRNILLASLLVLVACGTGAEFAEDDPEIIIFEDSLALASFNEHSFTMKESGTVNFTLTTLDATEIETGEPIDNALLVLILGRPDENVGCKTSSSNFLQEGGSFQLFLAIEDYCLRVGRSTTMPAESLVDYTITLTVGLE